MYFRDIIGQERVKLQLRKNIDEGQLAHALLFTGVSGTGKLPLAVAMIQYLFCKNRNNGEACGKCPSCIKMDKLIHSDLHFAFPVIKRKNSSDSGAVADEYIDQWREILITQPYFGYSHWLDRLEVENQQPIIYEKESGEILRKLSMKSREGGWKVMIIWLPEKMNVICANKLLKIIEEPPKETLFILISEQSENIIPTILSRTQRIEIPSLSKDEIYNELIKRYKLTTEDAANVSHQSSGSWEKAESLLELGRERKLYLDMFAALMRLAFQRKIKEMRDWSEEVASLGRERQKNLLDYCQRMIRDNFILNFKEKNMVFLSNEEMQFSSKFSPYVNENNIYGIIEELSEAQQHIEQNVNAKMIFFDMALRMIVLIKNR